MPDESTNPSRRFLPRFSLRTLLLFVMLCASAFGLWYRWEPAVRTYPLPQASTSVVYKYVLSSDGMRVGACTEDGTILLWRVSDFAQIMEVSAYSQTAEDISFSPDSKLLVTCGRPGPATVWDCETGKELFAAASHTGSAVAVSLGAEFSGEGQYLWTINTDGMEVWDAVARKRLFVIPEAKEGLGRFAMGSSLFSSGTAWFVLPGGKEVEPPLAKVAFYVPVKRDGDEAKGLFVGKSETGPGLCIHRFRSADWFAAAMPELWLTVGFSLLLLWSLVREFKTLRKAAT